MSITRHNKKTRFTIDTEGFNFIKLADLFDEKNPDETHVIHGVYINEQSIYGASPFAALEDCFVNLPSHMTDTIRSILDDEQDCADIESGNVAIKISPYHSEKYNRDTYVVDFVDLKEQKKGGKK